MNYRQRGQNRRQWRRLPPVERPPRPRPLTFWVSLRGAAQWLRKHQAIIETAVGLLETYPSLIQETALDALWDFLAPFFNIYMENRDSSGQASLGKGRQTEQRKAGGAGAPKHSPTRLVPDISITQDAREDENDPGDGLPHDLPSGQDRDESDADVRTPHVYVCVHGGGPGHDVPLHLQVIDAIVHDFFVKSSPGDSSGDLACRDSAREKDLSQASASVFILDEASLNCPECLKDLSAAWALDLPMVFVKNSGFTIPTPLPDVVLQHNLGLGDSSAASRASTPVFPARQGSVSPISAVSGRRSRAKLRKQRSFPSVRPASVRRQVGGRPTHSVKRDSRLALEADVVLALLDGYRHALIFEEAKRDACALALRQRLHSLLDPSASNVTSHIMAASFSSSTLHADGDCLSRQGSKFLSVPDTISGESPASEPIPKSNATLHHNVDTHTCLPLSSKSASCLSHECSTPLRSSELKVPGLNVLSPKPRPSSPWHRSNRSNRQQAVTSAGSAHRLADSNHHLPSHAFTHLQQVQKRIQQEHTKFLASMTSLVDEVGDPSLANSPDALARETVYMVCQNDKSGGEPRLVKWPPEDSQPDEHHDLRDSDDSLSDLFSDSPTNFRELDLSILVNLRNGTPDSESSTIF